MSSAIDDTKPTSGSATTSSVRSNFTASKDEINELQRVTEDSVVAAGTANALTADFTVDVALADGVMITVQAALTNTAAVTIDVDGTGAKAIVKLGGSALAGGDILSDQYLILKYDLANTRWAFTNLGGGGPSLGTAAIIRTNAQNISEDITFLGTENGSTVGPVTIDDTFTVTVTSGSTWVIL